MFVGVMDLRNPRRWDHSGLSHQGLVICWIYKIWSPDGTNGEKKGRPGSDSVTAQAGTLLQRWESPCVWERQTADNLQAGSWVTYCNLFCWRWTTEERRMKQSQIWELVYDLEFLVWFITISTFSPQHHEIKFHCIFESCSFRLH